MNQLNQLLQMDQHTLFTIAVVALIPLGILFEFFKRSRERRLIDGWANVHHYKILRCERRWFFFGPFMWNSSEHQTVYHVTVHDTHGKELKAFIRCGGYFSGILSSNIDVRWDVKH